MSADALVIALVEQLITNGTLSDDDVNDMAERLDAEGEEAAAHWARAALVQATVAGITSDDRAEDARSRFRVVTAAIRSDHDFGGSRNGSPPHGEQRWRPLLAQNSQE